MGSRDKWNPTTRETAGHSLPYVLAVALTKGDIWLDDFTDERIREPGLHALMQKIKVKLVGSGLALAYLALVLAHCATHGTEMNPEMPCNPGKGVMA